MKRLTTVAVFDDVTNSKLESFVGEGFCKVPTMIENRQEMDTLPYHITLPEIQQIKNANTLSVRTQESKKGGFGLYLDTDVGHITLGIFDKEEDAQNAYQECLKNFQPFIVNIKAIRVYEIYPAKLIKEEIVK